MSAPTVHARDLVTSTLLSRYWKEDMIAPDGVIRVLNQAHISFVLVGAYGLAGWVRDPRATQDVDIIVAARHHKKALQALLAAFPRLEVEEHEVVSRLRDRETKAVAIDVMRPFQQPMSSIFKHTHPVTVGDQRYRVPSLEMALVMKFAAMVSPNRREKDKLQDGHDFIQMVEANPNLREDRLAELATLVYRDAGKTILEFVGRARTGQRLYL